MKRIRSENRHTAVRRKEWRWTLVVVALIATGPATSSQAALVTTSLRDASGDPRSTQVTAGSFFDVFVELDTDTALTAGRVRLQADSSAEGIFQIHSVVFGPGWSNDANYVFDPSGETLAAANSYQSSDIASLAIDSVSGVGPSTHTFVTIRVDIAPSGAQGSYPLSLNTLRFGDTAFDAVPSVSPDVYEVQIVPEPQAFVLGIISLAALGLWRRSGFPTTYRGGF